MKSYLTDETKRAILEKTKALYAKLPKERDAVLAT